MEFGHRGVLQFESRMADQVWGARLLSRLKLDLGADVFHSNIFLTSMALLKSAGKVDAAVAREA